MGDVTPRLPKLHHLAGAATSSTQVGRLITELRLSSTFTPGGRIALPTPCLRSLEPHRAQQRLERNATGEGWQDRLRLHSAQRYPDRRDPHPALHCFASPGQAPPHPVPPTPLGGDPPPGAGSGTRRHQGTPRTRPHRRLRPRPTPPPTPSYRHPWLRPRPADDAPEDPPCACRKYHPPWWEVVCAVYGRSTGGVARAGALARLALAAAR